MKFGSESKVKTNAAGVAAGGFVIGDFAAIKHILANQIYKNPIQTLVQEYLSNARDALRAANKPDGKIVVKVPHDNNAAWSVRDYGIGMDDNDVRSVFTAYGVSTKRANDVQTGGFGIGSKSAFAYAKTFVVVAFKGGVRREYIMATESPDHPAGSFIQTVEEKTSEPDGVEIQIPVEAKDFSKFREATFRTVEFWENKPEVIGASYQAKEAVARTKHAQFFEGHSMGKLFFILDGIPYPCPSSIHDVYGYNSSSKGLGLITRKLNCSIGIHFSTGELSPASTREDIQDSPDNRKVIEERAAEVIKEIDEFVAKSLASTTIVEMFQRSRFVAKLFSVEFENSVTVGGEVFSYKSGGSLFKFGTGIEATLVVDGRHSSTLRVDRGTTSTRHFYREGGETTGIYIRLDRNNKGVTFVHIDEKITMADVLRKLEQNLGDREYIVLSSESNPEKLEVVSESLSAVRTSDYTFTKPQRAKRSEGTVSYMVSLSDRRSSAISSMMSKRYVYAPVDDRTMLTELFKDRNIRDFVNNAGYESIGLSPRAAKQIEEAGILLVRLDKFLSDSAAIVGDEVRNSIVSRSLRETVDQFQRRVYFPSLFVKQNKESLNDALVDVMTDIAAMKDRVTKQFPFTKQGYVPDKVQKEILTSAAAVMKSYLDVIEEAKRLLAKVPVLTACTDYAASGFVGTQEDIEKFRSEFNQHMIEYVNTQLGGAK
jgi:anti-sigma regulatory factor (Ser/Thr protein kinase)